MAFGSKGGPGGRSRYLRGKVPQSKDEHRINERIRVPKVRLIDHKGTQVGVVDTSTALKMAKDVGLDLMEVSPNSKPPVCKITDYGKFKYEKKKKEAQARKKQTVIKVKEVQLRPNTDQHDLEYKLKNICTFLKDGDKVKINLLFRGRQIAHAQQGKDILKDIEQKVGELGTVESPPKLEGRKMIMIIVPTAKKVSLAAKKAAAEAEKKAKEAESKNKKAKSDNKKEVAKAVAE